MATLQRANLLSFVSCRGRAPTPAWVIAGLARSQRAATNARSQPRLCRLTAVQQATTGGPALQQRVATGRRVVLAVDASEVSSPLTQVPAIAAAAAAASFPPFLATACQSSLVFSKLVHPCTWECARLVRPACQQLAPMATRCRQRSAGPISACINLCCRIQSPPSTGCCPTCFGPR